MYKLKKLLCPTDFSPESDEALRYALALAFAYKAKLFLCYCSDGRGDFSATLAEEEKKEIEILFEDAILRHLGIHDPQEFNVELLMVEGCTDAAQGITETAAEIETDLIVMRSRRRPRAAALLGSTAESVCRTAPCPVFVTHPHEREWVGLSSGDIDLRNILVAYDFSDDSERALNFGMSIGEEYDAEVHILNVLQRPWEDGPEISWTAAGIDNVYNSAVARLRKVVPDEASLWCNVKPVVRWGKPYQEILAYAKENEIDLICMGASGGNFAIGSLFGSNVDRVLRQSPCPVLIARPLKPAIKTVTQKEGIVL